MPASKPDIDALEPPRWPLWAAAVALAGLAAAALYQISFYLRLPVDLLSFAESPFVQDIIKLRLDAPLYTPPADNNSYPYTPGTQLLTYAIASAFGRGDSVAALRVVQYGYVLAATAVGVGIVASLRRRVIRARAPLRPVWLIASAALLLLVANDPRHNPYTHSLHNDGLALLVSSLAYWVLVEDTRRPRGWLLALSCVIPALGFLVKQSLVIWLPLALAFYVASGRVRLWRAALLGLAGAVAWAVVVGVCYAVWGQPFLWWVFEALGSKAVAPARSALHLLEAGAYLSMGLVAGWWLIAGRTHGTEDGRPDTPPAPSGSGAAAPKRSPGPDRPLLALWGLWLLLIVGESYTSGVAWVSNHLGPGVFLATCWFLVGLRTMWRDVGLALAAWRLQAWSILVAAILVSAPGALGLVRLPRDPVPPDLARYVADIEREFAGIPAEDVLLDNGSWIYLREGVSPRDRSSPVALHVGANQTEVGREHLEDTLIRIQEGRYAKILTRELESERFPYDYQRRGSGIREALVGRYDVVRRIPAVEGVEQWWPRGLLAEVYVLERREP